MISTVGASIGLANLWLKVEGQNPTGSFKDRGMVLAVAKAGETLWRRGDTATEMLYVHSGTLRLVEYGEILGPGSLVGEIGLFAPDNRRTQSLECASDCTLYSLTAPAMYRLYYQNPKLGFHIMRLVAGRLIRDADQARATAGLPGKAADPQPPVPVAA